ALGLVVTPQIGPDKTILLTIVATNDQADFSNTSQGLPSITTNEADAEVLIKDGETVVIGGILTSTEQESHDSVPGISKIPFLGELFKNNSKTETTDELLIFITPRVIEQ
ncbi:MAG: type IV pilus secretin PilQ, partial [Dissulfurispiraceae bacterium]